MHDMVKKHLMEPMDFELEGRDGTKDTFQFKPLQGKNWIELMCIDVNNFDKDTMATMVKLIAEMVKKSYPDWTDETIENFIVYHFSELSAIIWEVNSPMEFQKEAKERIKDLKKKTKEKNESAKTTE